MVAVMTPGSPVAAPLELHGESVRAEWIDYNDHMNLAYYVLAFDHATDAFLDFVDLGQAYKQRAPGTTFVAETHVTYDREVVCGDALRFTTQLLDFDARRLHFAHQMFHAGDGYRAATNELMMLHVDPGARRAAPMPPAVLDRLARIRAAHAKLPRPAGLSRVMGLRAKAAGTG